jgi:23S rRNA (guanosine2251-2'-O)-methyltransferase
LIKELIRVARMQNVPFTFVPEQKLNRLSTKNHQGVICMLATVQYADLQNIIDKIFNEGREPFLLIVDRVTDVRNFGAIARTVECAGLDAIIIGDAGNCATYGRCHENFGWRAQVTCPFAG